MEFGELCGNIAPEISEGGVLARLFADLVDQCFGELRWA